MTLRLDRQHQHLLDTLETQSKIPQWIRVSCTPPGGSQCSVNMICPGGKRAQKRQKQGLHAQVAMGPPPRGSSCISSNRGRVQGHERLGAQEAVGHSV